MSLLLNRRAFVRELTRALSIARRRNTSSSLIFLEVDNLKSVNKQFGLSAGDAAIELVGSVIENNVPDGNVVGRVGGAEFGVILSGEPEELAQERVKMLADIVSGQPLVWESNEISLRLVWGVHFLQDDEDSGAAMNATDRQMRQLENADPGG